MDPYYGSAPRAPSYTASVSCVGLHAAPFQDCICQDEAEYDGACEYAAAPPGAAALVKPGGGRLRTAREWEEVSPTNAARIRAIRARLQMNPYPPGVLGGVPSPQTPTSLSRRTQHPSYPLPASVPRDLPLLPPQPPTPPPATPVFAEPHATRPPVAVAYAQTPPPPQPTIVVPSPEVLGGIAGQRSPFASARAGSSYTAIL
eukprot:TRINITY_DN5103_c0_g1_i1.p2 TRINITY_DN5103_c0_g1~~TRINITY_DN5103_c0_g1_i1.p2  ORF type:complete len:202 (+),score=33.92 TRINITY_DN5103_c0_g1_i1:64-669(+)